MLQSFMRMSDRSLKRYIKKTFFFFNFPYGQSRGSVYILLKKNGHEREFLDYFAALHYKDVKTNQYF